MEASTAHAATPIEGDPFAAGQPEGGDPFAQSDPTSFGESDLAEEIAADDVSEAPAQEAAEPPLVNREGAAVQKTETPVPAPVAAAVAAQAAEAAQAPAEAPAPAPDQEAPQAAPAAQEAPPAPAPATEAASGSGTPPAAPPAQPQTDAAKGELRRYQVLYQTAPAQWTEADLADAESKEISTVTEDGVTWLLARNADHARRLAWTLLNRPEGGVTVNAVAQSSWKPKRIRPATPKPDRERLEIS